MRFLLDYNKLLGSFEGDTTDYGKSTHTLRSETSLNSPKTITESAKLVLKKARAEIKPPKLHQLDLKKKPTSIDWSVSKRDSPQNQNDKGTNSHQRTLSGTDYMKSKHSFKALQGEKLNGINKNNRNNDEYQLSERNRFLIRDFLLSPGCSGKEKKEQTKKLVEKEKGQVTETDSLLELESERNSDNSAKLEYGAVWQKKEQDKDKSSLKKIKKRMRLAKIDISAQQLTQDAIPSVFSALKHLSPINSINPGIAFEKIATSTDSLISPIPELYSISNDKDMASKNMRDIIPNVDKNTCNSKQNLDSSIALGLGAEDQVASTSAQNSLSLNKDTSFPLTLREDYASKKGSLCFGFLENTHSIKVVADSQEKLKKGNSLKFDFSKQSRYHKVSKDEILLKSLTTDLSDSNTQSNEVGSNTLASTQEFQKDLQKCAERFIIENENQMKRFCQTFDDLYHSQAFIESSLAKQIQSSSETIIKDNRNTDSVVMSRLSHHNSPNSGQLRVLNGKKDHPQKGFGHMPYITGNDGVYVINIIPPAQGSTSERDDRQYENNYNFGTFTDEAKPLRKKYEFMPPRIDKPNQEVPSVPYLTKLEILEKRVRDLIEFKDCGEVEDSTEDFPLQQNDDFFNEKVVIDYFNSFFSSMLRKSRLSCKGFENDATVHQKVNCFRHQNAQKAKFIFSRKFKKQIAMIENTLQDENEISSIIPDNSPAVVDSNTLTATCIQNERLQPKFEDDVRLKDGSLIECSTAQTASSFEVKKKNSKFIMSKLLSPENEKCLRSSNNKFLLIYDFHT